MPAEAKERPLLAVSRKDLESGPKHVRATLPAVWLKKKLAGANEDGAPGLGASRDGAVDLVLTPSGGDNFLLRGHVRATVDATCGRCLDPAEIPVDSETTLLILPKTVAGS